jgi:hypothetical protein
MKTKSRLLPPETRNEDGERRLFPPKTRKVGNHPYIYLPDLMTK